MRVVALLVLLAAVLAGVTGSVWQAGTRDARLADARERAVRAARDSARKALDVELRRLEEQVRLVAMNEELRKGIATDSGTVVDQIATEGLRSLREHEVHAVGRPARPDQGLEALHVLHGLERVSLDAFERHPAVAAALASPNASPSSGAIRLPMGAALLAAAPVTSYDRLSHGYVVIGDVLAKRSLDQLATQAGATVLLSDGAKSLGRAGAETDAALLTAAIGTEGQYVERTLVGADGTVGARVLAVAPGVSLWVAASIAAEAAAIADGALATQGLVWGLSLVLGLGLAGALWRRGAPAPVEADTAGSWATGPSIPPTPRTSTAFPGTTPRAPGPTAPFLRAPVPAEPAADPLLFGRYRLVDRLGAGGMAEVWTAVMQGEQGFQRPFVVKRIRRDLTGNTDLVQQFIDEANLAGQLVHSNVVPVFDFGRLGEEYFLAQEYILGRDLGKVTQALAARGRRLDPALAVYLLAETLKALDYAHTLTDKSGRPLGIVHRDVSPNNVLLSARGEVKLIDFGIAKSVSKIAQTELGTVKGNVRFMAPEQARGEPTDPRADLFSLAVTTWFALSGETLYPATNPYELLLAAARGPGEAELLRVRTAPAPLDAVLTRGMAARPEDRFASAQQFLEAVQPAAPSDGARRAAALMAELFGEELRAQQARFESLLSGTSEPEAQTVQRQLPKLPAERP